MKFRIKVNHPVESWGLRISGGCDTCESPYLNIYNVEPSIFCLNITTTSLDSLKTRTSTEIFADLRSQDPLPPKIMINLMPVSFEKNTAFGTNLSGTVIVIEESHYKS